MIRYAGRSHRLRRIGLESAGGWRHRRLGCRADDQRPDDRIRRDRARQNRVVPAQHNLNIIAKFLEKKFLSAPFCARTPP